mmetsp:Transcript_17118/g.19301  ORF Transcript_17118/g.19301 Transcript_17118/m.19301 type:complete len:446 (+) Transcript_17118:61-1398(+)
MGMFSRSNKSTSKNDGLPFVRGKKVTVNRGRDNNNSRRGSSSLTIEERLEMMKNVFVYGVAVSILFYIFQTNNNVLVPESSDGNVVTIPSPALEAASVSAVVPSAPTPPAPPATTCTAKQRELVLYQLPNNAACSKKGHSGCSFREATTGCQNPILARTFFANTNDFKPVSSSSSIPIPFTAVIVRWGNNNIPLDLLRIGSGFDPKYGMEWGYMYSRNTCLKPITTTIATTKEGDQPTRLPPQVVVLDWENPTSSVLHEFNKKYHDQELIIEDTINMNRGGEYAGKKDSFTTLIQSKLIVSQQQQQQEQPPPSIIHYLDLVGRSGGYDYIILMELLPELLQNVRFLHFEYNNKQKWYLPSNTLTDLIAHLQTHGLICYWSGDEQTQYGLWRITDCFLDHYDRKNWARIQCVSGVHADVQELAAQMETQFLTTLQRTDINNSLDAS